MRDRENGILHNYQPGPDTVQNGEILSIFENSKNRLYIGQQNLSIFNREDGSVKSIFPHEQDVSTFDGKTTRKIVEDKMKNLWLATEAGLVKLSPDRVINYYLKTPP